MALRSLFRGYSLGVSQYSVSHLRIFGKIVVDYWPSTNKVWIVGTSGKAAQMTPRQVCELAAGIIASPADLLNAELDAQCREHMSRDMA